MTHLACHASAPQGMKCADCTMSGIPCPACYTAHFERAYPGYDATRMATMEMDLRLIIRALLRSRMNTIPKHLAVLLEIYRFNLDGTMNDADLKHMEPRGDMIDRLAAALEAPVVLRPATDLVEEVLEGIQRAKDLVERLR